MNVKDLKEWLNKLPEDTLDFKVVIRDLKILEDEKVYNRDVSVGYGIVDQNTKQLNLFDLESTKVIQKIRANAAAAETIEGSNVTEEKVD